MNKIKLIFCGTPEFSIKTLDALNNCDFIDIRYVITMPDRPFGRGQKLRPPPVATYAKEHNLPLFQTENINREEEFLKKIKHLNIDLFLVIAFGQFLNTRILNMPRLGCFNIHGSLLPKYRGAAPIQYALLNGDTKTGVSIQKMCKKMDAGDIAFTKEMDIYESDNSGSLFKRMEMVAAESCIEFLELLQCDNYHLVAQNEDQVSFAPTISKVEGHLNFKESSAKDILNRVRALSPRPGAYFFANNKRIKVHEARIENSEIPTNKIDLKLKTLSIGCKEGSIRFSNLQLEGKKPTTDGQFINSLKDQNLFITSD